MQEERANAAQSSRLGTMRNNTTCPTACTSRIRFTNQACDDGERSARHTTPARDVSQTHARDVTHTLDSLEKRALAAQSLLLGTMRNEHAHVRPLPARHAYGSRIIHATTASAARVTQRRTRRFTTHARDVTHTRDSASTDSPTCLGYETQRKLTLMTNQGEAGRRPTTVPATQHSRTNILNRAHV